MKVKCVSTLINDPRISRTLDYSINDELLLNATYVVYSISLWQMRLHYLLLPREAGWPDWYPAELFESIDKLLYLETYYEYFGMNDARGVNALWGYKEMILDFGHYANLIEHEGNAMKNFLKRKQEIDEYYR